MDGPSVGPGTIAIGLPSAAGPARQAGVHAGLCRKVFAH